MKSAFVQFALLFAITASTQAATPSHYVSSRDCLFEFDYPLTWEATALPPNKWTNCAVQVRPKNFAKLMAENDVDVYTVDVSAPGGGTFLNAVSNAGFDFFKGEWVTVGRQGMRGEATLVRDKPWFGLRGTAPVGCHHEHGGYAGLCEFERVVLQDEHGNVWAMEGGPQTGEAFALILATFKFTGWRASPAK